VGGGNAELRIIIKRRAATPSLDIGHWTFDINRQSPPPHPAQAPLWGAFCVGRLRSAFRRALSVTRHAEPNTKRKSLPQPHDAQA
jgi:hypothetical protein